MKVITKPRKYVLWMAVLGVAYILSEGSMSGWKWGLGEVMTHRWLGVSSSSTNEPANVSSPAQWPSSQDVSDNVVQRVTQSVSNITGLNDMVVLPDTQPGTYTVSSMVDLGDTITLSTSDLSSTVDHAVNTYFQDVFSKQDDVSEAEIYFTLHGNVVASAGLGTNMYHQVATVADTGEGGLAASLLTMAPSSTSDTNNHWFEVQATQN